MPLSVDSLVITLHRPRALALSCSWTAHNVAIRCGLQWPLSSVIHSCCSDFHITLSTPNHQHKHRTRKVLNDEVTCLDTPMFDTNRRRQTVCGAFMEPVPINASFNLYNSRLQSPPYTGSRVLVVLHAQQCLLLSHRLIRCPTTHPPPGVLLGDLQ